MESKTQSKFRNFINNNEWEKEGYTPNGDILVKDIFIDKKLTFSQSNFKEEAELEACILSNIQDISNILSFGKLHKVIPQYRLGGGNPQSFMKGKKKIGLMLRVDIFCMNENKDILIIETKLSSGQTYCVNGLGQLFLYKATFQEVYPQSNIRLAFVSDVYNDAVSKAINGNSLPISYLVCNGEKVLKVS